MNKSQAIHKFWNSFSIPAFDENTVPEYVDDGNGNQIKLMPPYITYNVSLDELDHPVSMSASIWYRDPSWASVTEKSIEISDKLKNGGETIPLDEGYLWIVKGHPFMQRMDDPNDDMIRRIYINIMAEYLSH